MNTGTAKLPTLRAQHAAASVLTWITAQEVVPIVWKLHNFEGQSMLDGQVFFEAGHEINNDRRVFDVVRDYAILLTGGREVYERYGHDRLGARDKIWFDCIHKGISVHLWGLVGSRSIPDGPQRCAAAWGMDAYAKRCLSDAGAHTLHKDAGGFEWSVMLSGLVIHEPVGLLDESDDDRCDRCGRPVPIGVEPPMVSVLEESSSTWQQWCRGCVSTLLMPEGEAEK